MTWTASSAARWPTGCSPCCWGRPMPGSCSGLAGCCRRAPAWWWPGDPGSGGVPAGPPPYPSGGGSAVQPTPPRRRPNHRGVQRTTPRRARPGHAVDRASSAGRPDDAANPGAAVAAAATAVRIGWRHRGPATNLRSNKRQRMARPTCLWYCGSVMRTTLSGYQGRLEIAAVGGAGRRSAKIAAASYESIARSAPYGATAPLPRGGPCQPGVSRMRSFASFVARQANGLISAAGEAHAARMTSS
jgi:hypothetical protein